MRAHPFDNRLRIQRKNQQLTRWNCRFIQRACDRLFRHSGVHGAFVDIKNFNTSIGVCFSERAANKAQADNANSFRGSISFRHRDLPFRSNSRANDANATHHIFKLLGQKRLSTI